MLKVRSIYSGIAPLCAALILAACGGGAGGYGATASAPSADTSVAGVPTVSGTVTGFGSVIVDGKRIDNHAAGASKELEDGSTLAQELKLGQHVEVEHDGNLVATRIRVSSEVEGLVEKVDVAATALVVMGQAILLNTDAAAGPVTVFGLPYTKLADVKVGDAVEVHALIKTDAAGKVTLQATRIEKRGADDAFNRVRGVIADLSATAKTFKLGDLLIDYSTAVLVPTGATLANGQVVKVALPVGKVATGTAVVAKYVKLYDLKSESGNKSVELGGPISALDATAKTFTINGVIVDASAATFNQNGKSFADLKVGAYVVLKGTFAADKSLKASTIVIRGIDDEKGREVELHGTVMDFHSLADFTVRGVQVDASAAAVDAATCGAAASLADGSLVEVKGAMTATGGVKAATVKCEKAQEGKSVVEMRGAASKVDATAKTFTLTNLKGAVNVQWSAATMFVKVDAASVDGKLVKVEGTLSGATLLAEKISRSD